MYIKYFVDSYSFGNKNYDYILTKLKLGKINRTKILTK